jgi:hypothetical protein
VSVPPEAQLWSLMRGAMTAQALRVVAGLRIADQLAAYGAQTVEELAAGHDVDVIHRVLRALASEGVFAEEQDGVFRNTPASELLRTDGEQRWTEFAVQFGGEWYDAFAHLPHAVLTGEATFPLVFGADFETWLRDDPDRLEIFSRSMEMGAEERIGRVADLAFDDEVVVDIGGGTGLMLAELRRRHPRIRPVLFDLPEVVEGVDEPEGGEVVAGDFLERVPTGDAYVLSRILHGMGDEKALRVLTNVRKAANPGARVLIIDAVIPEGNEPHGSKWLDLLMLVIAGGRERTEGQWKELLEQAELELVALEDGLIQARCP